jgi:regulator of nonsense transcripts 1
MLWRPLRGRAPDGWLDEMRSLDPSFDSRVGSAVEKLRGRATSLAALNGEVQADDMSIAETAAVTLLDASLLNSLNSSQRQAALSVESEVVSLVQGPPGTGKTHTCVAIAKAWQRGRVLVCAPSNVAVNNIAQRLHEAGLRVLRIAAASQVAYDPEVEGPPWALEAQLDPIKREIASTGDVTKQRQLRRRMRKLKKDLISRSDVICCTCVKAPSVAKLPGTSFRLLIVDEATQGIEYEVMLPVLTASLERIVLVGDHRQLGPLVLSAWCRAANLSRSLFERLLACGSSLTLLDEQYRMHPSISLFPIAEFYRGSVRDAAGTERNIATEQDERRLFSWPAQEPLYFFDCGGRDFVSMEGGGGRPSYANALEASACATLAYRWIQSGTAPVQIGIITPYDAQQTRIREHLSQLHVLSREVEVANVDAFQGREKDFIIISCVRSNFADALGFLIDPTRLNVALTRARLGVVIVGDATTLRSDGMWRRLLINLHERALVFGGDDICNPAPLHFDVA